MTSKLVAELADAIGYQPTVRLIRAYGGRRLYIPRQADPEHPITLTVGHTAATQLCDQYPGTRLDLPDEQTSLLELRNRRIVAESQRGRETRALARDYGLSPRMIRKILDAAGARKAAGAARQAETVPPDRVFLTPGQ
ncbi:MULTISPECIES: Mor transcription activator family protein [unclassified Thioalkalivibrio]|uniref:Mor transcription activator family protein n=1 Tax=unclassified Thioalkalivibrio TaxID=2621013 RepID=UPI0003750DB9|nr:MULTISPECIES: Mor transcription activator family protein [unclassified Thioalkalivibrio]